MGNPTPDTIGYVSFCDEKYLSLAEILMRHLSSFSKYGMELVTINCDCPFMFPRMATRRIELDKLDTRFVRYLKLQIASESKWEYGLILDADSIPLDTVDDVLDSTMARCDSFYPICARHPHSPHIRFKDSFDSMRAVMGIKSELTQYVYACFVYTLNCKLFLKRCYDCLLDLESRGILPTEADEGMLNLYLAAEHPGFQDIGYNFIPNHWVYEDWIRGNLSAPSFKDYTSYGCPVRMHVLHGCKHIGIAQNYSQRILARHLASA